MLRFPWLTSCKALAKADGGSAAIYVALTIPLFVGAAGLAVDLSSWYTARRTMQTGADAAAYAAALTLAQQGLTNAPNLAALQAAADDAASRNGMITPVTLNSPPSQGLSAGDSSAVEVVATQPAPVHFSSLFLNSAPMITTRSVAKALVSDACVWALDPSARAAFSVAGSAQVELGCGVVVNSDHEEAALEQTGSSCLRATSITVHGGYAGTCALPPPEVYAPNYGDPLSYLQAPTFGACDYPNPVIVDASMAKQYSGGLVPLDPGVYCGGIAIKANQKAVFAPGLYVLKGGEFYIAGNAKVSNTENAFGGVTFYLTGSGGNYASIRFESGADVTLTPVTSGPLANVLFFQDPNAPSNGSNVIAGGINMNLTGILYFPSQHVEFTGGSAADEADVLIVARTVEFSGNSRVSADYAQSLLPQQYHARFVE